MKKRGFTLVELLAVIAILAILVIIALPNVMKLFNRAKEQAFETELKEIYKTAQQQWIADSMFNTQERVYAKKRDSNCEHTLDMTGRSELEYYIKIDKSGNVVTYKASDGTYQYSYTGTNLKIEDISGIEQISKLDNSDIIPITCNEAAVIREYKYVAITPRVYIGSELPSETVTYDDYRDAIDSWDMDFFIRYTLENGIVTEAYLGILSDAVFYLKSADESMIETNKQIAFDIFGEDSCSIYNSELKCVPGPPNTPGDLGVYINIPTLRINYADNRYLCFLSSEGYSYCKTQ